MRLDFAKRLRRPALVPPSPPPGQPLSRGVAVAVAWGLLVRDKGRFWLLVVAVGVSLAGVAVVLGVMDRMVAQSLAVVRLLPADVWVVANDDEPQALAERHLYAAIGAAGVAQVEPLLVATAGWRGASGVADTVSVVGADHPRFTAVAARGEPVAVAVEAGAAAALGGVAPGETAEINGQAVRVGAVIHPWRPVADRRLVVAALADAEALLGVAPGRLTHLRVIVEGGGDPDRVRQDLAERLPGAAVFTAAGMGRHAVAEMVESGVGVALTGLGVGLWLAGVAAAVWLLRGAAAAGAGDWAALKVIGAGPGLLARLVFYQGAMVGGCGLGLGGAVAAAVVQPGQGLHAWPLAAVVLVVLAAALAVAAAAATLPSVLRVDAELAFLP